MAALEAAGEDAPPIAQRAKLYHNTSGSMEEMEGSSEEDDEEGAGEGDDDVYEEREATPMHASEDFRSDGPSILAPMATTSAVPLYLSRSSPPGPATLPAIGHDVPPLEPSFFPVPLSLDPYFSHPVPPPAAPSSESLFHRGDSSTLSAWTTDDPGLLRPSTSV
jgi:hypothetical protein